VGDHGTGHATRTRRLREAGTGDGGGETADREHTVRRRLQAIADRLRAGGASVTVAAGAGPPGRRYIAADFVEPGEVDRSTGLTSASPTGWPSKKLGADG